MRAPDSLYLVKSTYPVVLSGRSSQSEVGSFQQRLIIKDQFAPPTIDMSQEQTPRQEQLAGNPRYSNPLYFSFVVISSNVSSTSVNEL